MSVLSHNPPNGAIPIDLDQENTVVLLAPAQRTPLHIAYKRANRTRKENRCFE
jgi:hypothetical protein